MDSVLDDNAWDEEEEDSDEEESIIPGLTEEHCNRGQFDEKGNFSFAWAARGSQVQNYVLTATGNRVGHHHGFGKRYCWGVDVYCDCMYFEKQVGKTRRSCWK